MPVAPHKSSLGLDANVLGMLTYLAAAILRMIPIVSYVAFLAPLVVYFLEKGSPFVKYHAMQAFLLELVSLVLQIILLIPVVGLIVAGIVGIVVLVFAVIALIKAVQYKEYAIPFLGPIARVLMAKF